MPGLFSTLGSFAKKVIRTIRETGRSIAEAIGILPRQARDIEPATIAREFEQVAGLEARESLIANLPRTQVIADYLHTTVDVPFNRPYAYTVSISGRAVAGRVGPEGVKIGGRFTRDEFNITSNRRLTPEEVTDIAQRRFGAGGEYPLLSIRQISVTSAMVRD